MNIKAAKEKIYILGAGNQARETLGFYRDLGRFDEVNGLIEENCKKEGHMIDGKKVMDASIIASLGKDAVFIGAIGSPLRKRWIKGDF